jgi:hypothetical protein
MDEHIHNAITEGLRQRGVDVLTVQEDGRSGFPDVLLLDRALELERVMFSQDQDFLVEAQHRQSKGVAFSGVIFARQSRVDIGTCINDLELIAKALDIKDFANWVQFLPL